MLTCAPFGTTRDGKAVSRYTMATSGGVSVTFMSYGGAVIDVATPDRQGRPAPIVLGFRTLRDYETQGAERELYFGTLIGCYANWLARGHFRLDGQDYQVPITYPPNSIHGGVKGFNKRVWDIRPLTTSGQNVCALLTYTSADGEEGYPGTLKVTGDTCSRRVPTRRRPQRPTLSR